MTEIFCFSGTGNSLSVARDLARKLSARLISAATLMDEAVVTPQADTVGFVFPLYDFKAPRIIADLVKKMKDLDKCYVFAVCTYGIVPFDGLVKLDLLLKAAGARLSAGFAVAMPHNGIGSRLFSDANRQAQFNAWKSRLDEVASVISGKTARAPEKSGLIIPIVRSGFLGRMLPVLFKLLFRVMTRGWNSLALCPGVKCSGCGNCSRICPAGNIRMADGRPEWDSRCAGCLACLHWCPQGAVSLGGSDMDIARYHHPEITREDMAAFRKNSRAD